MSNSTQIVEASHDSDAHYIIALVAVSQETPCKSFNVLLAQLVII